MKRILVAIGTRPEAVKMCELIRRLKNKECFEVKVLATGQHREMLDDALGYYKIIPDYTFDIMKKGQLLSYITSEILNKVEGVFEEFKPDIVLVHGDTSSAFSVALAAFYREIPIGHVEAGLRTYNNRSPFPEEYNRRAIALMAKYHFAPTEGARANLIAEGIDSDDIFVTGNTVIDTLIKDIDHSYTSEYTDKVGDKRLIILTAHRRENLSKLKDVFSAVKRIVMEVEDVFLIYPMHENFKILSLAREVFSDTPRVYLTKPLSAYHFHNLLNLSSLVITDSGGVQEEALYLEKPTIVVRNETERKELLANKQAETVGTDENAILFAAKQMLNNSEIYHKSIVLKSFLGGGKASETIADILEFKIGEKRKGD